MNLYEFLGYHIGDGCILYNPKKPYYILEIAGNADDQIEYFEYLSGFIEKKFGIKPKVKIRKEKKGRCLRLRVDNKKFVEILIFKYKFPYKNKTYTVKIPNNYLHWKYLKHILRGIFEADGSLYFSRSKKCKYPTYPRLEIKTASKALAIQIFDILKRKEFKVHKMPCSGDNATRIYLSGVDMLNKWIKEIGFSDPKTISKYTQWKLLGFHIPRTTHPQRSKFLADVAKWLKPPPAV